MSRKRLPLTSEEPVASTQTQLTMSATLLPRPLAGALYALGTVIYLRCETNWWPTVFEYLELFHVLAVLAKGSATIAALHASGMLVRLHPLTGR